MNFKAVLALPKTARSAQTHKSISFIWNVWSTLYVYLCLQPRISKVFLWSLKQFFLTVGQNNFGNKICTTFIFFSLLFSEFWFFCKRSGQGDMCALLGYYFPAQLTTLWWLMIRFEKIFLRLGKSQILVYNFVSSSNKPRKKLSAYLEY